MPGQETESLKTKFEDEIKKFLRNNPFPPDEEITEFVTYLRISGYINDLTQESRFASKFFHQAKR
jgi:SOS response regulatory protein OraA/RecX